MGSAVGGYLFNALNLPAGPVLGGLAIIPSILGAALIVLLLGAVSGALARNSRV